MTGLTPARDFTPRPYQDIADDFLGSVRRCALWAGMGMGKTTTALTFVDRLSLVDSHPSLVLAPLRVARSTWPGEARKWKHLRHLEVVPVVGSAQERHTALFKNLQRGNASVFTTNYENLPWLRDTLRAAGKAWPFRTVVADEATRLKNFRLQQGGKRAAALGQIAHTHVHRFIELTGTPSPNGLKDLWGQIYMLDGGKRLGLSYDAFRDRWFRRGFQTEGDAMEPLPYANEQIQAALRGICLTLDPKDWFDLREPIVNNIYVDLPSKARRIYKEFEKQMFVEIGEHQLEAFNAASRTIKCLQLANGAAYIDEAQNFTEVHDEKIQALESIVSEAAGESILVAYHFKSDLARLRAAFPQARVLDSNPRTIDEWNAGRIPILLAHPQSAGHGLNLQDGGRQLVYFSHWWDLEQRQQILERIGPTRQKQAGHERPVFIHNIIARDTVDELVIARMDTKRSVQDELLIAMKRHRP